ncbi:MAG TPA: MATE family efflux transporter [Pirellulaceae bacterium]|nr:MATE family efflux transporter [Pirellulaceae bacterium]HMP69931.1 MATE family efflux transporter [Pirellulaceae bacterium]
MPRLAFPVLAEESLVLMVTWTDWWLCSRYVTEHADSAKAAMGLMAYVMWLIPSLFAAVAIGATALIARSVGGRQFALARDYANQAIMLGWALAVLLTAGFTIAGDSFIEAMNLQNRSAEYAKNYLWIVIPVIPLIMFEQVGSACLRGAGDTVTGFLAKLVVVIVNIAISIALVTGWGPFPALGWIGLAIGTAIGHSIGGTIILTALILNRAGLRLTWRGLYPNTKLSKQLFFIGMPGGLDMGVLLGSQLIFVAMVNSLGDAAAAAHGLAVQIEACAYLPGHAFQVAAATMVGQYLGAKQPELARKAAWVCFLVALVIMVTASTSMFFFGDQMSYFFTGDWDDPTTHNAASLLRIVAFGIPFLALLMVLTGALRGAGDTAWPMMFTLVGFLAIRIPLAAFLAYATFTLPVLGWEITGLGWGVQGAWYAMVCDLLVRSCLAVARFRQGGWQRSIL